MIGSIRNGAAGAALAAITAWGQSLNYPGCPDITKNDFTKTVLIDRDRHKIDEPIEMAVDAQNRIFWVERKGKVRMWDPAKPQTAVDLIKLPVYSGSEYGAVGIALDPGFTVNHWLYVYWAHDLKSVFRISRFTLNDTLISLESDRPILEIPFANRGCCHTGGSMTFDSMGNLWVSVGNNTDNSIGEATHQNYINEANVFGDDQRGSANTNSLLGKILRIKPVPFSDATMPSIGAGSTYEIPTGNLFPIGLYPAGKTRPEIYTMGHRNPYTISVDPYHAWLTWGDIGPDEHTVTEEHNLVTVPGFMGWPYFVGNNMPFRGNQNPLHPLNNSKNNTGLVELPPAQPAIRPYKEDAAITGPLYYYDGRQTNPHRLPPHFDRKWIFTDFNNGWVHVATVSNDGKQLIADNEFFPPHFLTNPLDLEMGQDGSLYALEYAGWFGPTAETRISRIDYTGSCIALQVLPPWAPTALEANRFNGASPKGLLPPSTGFSLPTSKSLTLPPGVSGVTLYSIQGQKVFTWQRTGTNPTVGNTHITLPEGLPAHGLIVRFHSP